MDIMKPVASMPDSTFASIVIGFASI